MIHKAAWSDLSPAILHDIVRLRMAIFVVEQQCPYPELDGRDVETEAVHVWSDDDNAAGAVTGYLRLLTDPEDRRRIGRVCVAPQSRGGGIAGALMAYALDLVGDHEVVLDAQSHLASWYARFGFAVSGPEFVEDGIPHVPMRRAAPTYAPTTRR